MSPLRLCLVSALAIAPLLAVDQAQPCQAVVYPADSGVIDVKAAYGAKGDGTTDDTEALRKALAENVGHFRTLYFPIGTYLVSGPLTFGADIAKCKVTILQGQHRDRTILKLKDRAEGFADPAKPNILLSFYDGESSGQAFCNSLCDMTVDTGSGNPGAIGVLYLAHNQGTVRDVVIRSGDGAGVRGLDLTRRWPGPAFIQRVTVHGFDLGVEVGHYDYSLCFEDLTLSGQRKSGLVNYENKLAIRRLVSRNSVPAIATHGSGYINLLDATLDGGDAKQAAIINKGRLVLRRVEATGYARLLDNQAEGGAKLEGLKAAEYESHGVSGLLSDKPKALNLPIRDAPVLPAEDPAQWVAVQGNDADAIQAAIEQAVKSRRSTVYLRPGTYRIDKTVRIHGSVRRLAGMLPELQAVFPLKGTSDAAFVVEDSSSGVVLIDRFWTTPWDRTWTMTWFENNDPKATLIMRNLLINGGAAYRTGAKGAGPLFIEDVCGSHFAFGPGQQVWARQINPENHHPLVTCDNATFWAMDLKTEGLQTVIAAVNQSKVELFGGYIFPIHAGAPQFPAFVITDSTAWLCYAEAIIAGSSSAYTVHVRETRGTETRDLTREATPRLGDGTRMTVFSNVGR